MAKVFVSRTWVVELQEGETLQELYAQHAFSMLHPPKSESEAGFKLARGADNGNWAGGKVVDLGTQIRTDVQEELEVLGEHIVR